MWSTARENNQLVAEMSTRKPWVYKPAIGKGGSTALLGILREIFLP